MMIGSRRIQFRPILTVFAAAGMAALIALGTWQLQRLAWKQDLIAKVESRVGSAPIPFEDALMRTQIGEDLEYAPVHLKGVFLRDSDVRLFGSYDGSPGYFLFTPLVVGREATVFINRGFVSQRSMAGRDLSELYAPNGDVVVEGLFRRSERISNAARLFGMTEKSSDGFWFIRAPERFAREFELSVSPYYVDSFAVPGVEAPLGGTTRLEFVNNHLQYALTWFGMAAALFGVWLTFTLQKLD